MTPSAVVDPGSDGSKAISVWPCSMISSGAARPDPDQRHAGPGINQTAAGSGVQHGVVPVGRIDQAGPADSVFTGQDGRHPDAVPRDQLGGPGVLAIDAPGHPIVGIGCDDPDLPAGAPVGRDLAGQPLTI